MLNFFSFDRNSFLFFCSNGFRKWGSYAFCFPYVRLLIQGNESINGVFLCSVLVRKEGNVTLSETIK